MAVVRLDADVLRPRSGEDQVFSALVDLGGAAHLDAIVLRVTRDRRRRGLNGCPSIRIMVETALHHMRSEGDAPEAGPGARVYRPFGPGSRRWAVCRTIDAAFDDEVLEALRFAAE